MFIKHGERWGWGRPQVQGFVVAVVSGGSLGEVL